MGKMMPAVKVFRAPGGALPPSFWNPDEAGVLGGVEAAFMSTTTAKEEAMHYARRAKGRVLFELQQGMVSRGASISWLSQARNRRRTARSCTLPPSNRPFVHVTAVEPPVGGTAVETRV